MLAVNLYCILFIYLLHFSPTPWTYTYVSPRSPPDAFPSSPLRAGRQEAGAQKRGREGQRQADDRGAAEEFAPADAPEGGFAPEIFQIAVHFFCLSVPRSEEHTSEIQSLMRISYAVFCLKKKKTTTKQG